MILNKGLVLVVPEKSNLGHFDEGEVQQNIGIVQETAKDVEFCGAGDKVVFFTIKPIIKDFGWYVLEEQEILINLSKAGIDG
jgi:hypothetical protein